MKSYFSTSHLLRYILILVVLILISACSKKRSGPPKVLVFTKTAGFVHSSISEGVDAIIKLGEENNFIVDTTARADMFNEENLSQYAAVIFLNTTGDVLNDAQQLEFNRFIQAGGGYVGIHAAADTEYDWPWYGQLAGAWFNGHPNDPNVWDSLGEGYVTRNQKGDKKLAIKALETWNFVEYFVQSLGKSSD